MKPLTLNDPDLQRTAILIEVSAERNRQEAEGWTAAHDDQHAPGMWMDLIRTHALKGYADLKTGWRRKLITIAALCVAAVEAHDRRTARERSEGAGHGG